MSFPEGGGLVGVDIEVDMNVVCLVLVEKVARIASTVSGATMGP